MTHSEVWNETDKVKIHVTQGKTTIFIGNMKRDDFFKVVSIERNNILLMFQNEDIKHMLEYCVALQSFYGLHGCKQVPFYLDLCLCLCAVDFSKLIL